MAERMEMNLSDFDYGILINCTVRACTGWYRADEDMKHQAYQMISEQLERYDNRTVLSIYRDLCNAYAEKEPCFYRIDKSDPALKKLYEQVVAEQEIREKEGWEARSGQENLAKIDTEDFSLVCYCAADYAIGRQTMVPGIVCEMLIKYVKNIQDEYLKKTIDRIQNAASYGGDTCDKPAWMSALNTLEAEAKRRFGKPE